MEVERGEVPLSPGLAARILQQFGRQVDEIRATGEGEPGGPLSRRELEVLKLVALGLTYKEAGARLGLAERTIKYHMGEIIARLHLENRAQVIEYARRTGLVRT
jgi:DNA-binding NarL/FixJ family response regulator